MTRGSGNTPSQLFMENRKMAPQSEGEAMFDRFFRTGFELLERCLVCYRAGDKSTIDSPARGHQNAIANERNK